MRQSFGGDTLNTAVYLARLARQAINVRYITTMGVDDLSAGMLERWRAEGIDTSDVLRDPSRLPGLYLIRLDERGERSFRYWRGESAARYLLKHPDFPRVMAALTRADQIYLSGISLGILPAEDRERLTALLVQLAARGTSLVLDNNYRSALWPSAKLAREAIAALLPSSELVLTTFDDERRLWKDQTPEATRSRLHSTGVSTVVIKLGAQGCLYSHRDVTFKMVPSAPCSVVDTTAAGDAFNAAFLAGWLTGRGPQDCCRLGNALAGIVIQHRGAVVPGAVTPSLPELLDRLGPTDVIP